MWRVLQNSVDLNILENLFPNYGTVFDARLSSCRLTVVRSLFAFQSTIENVIVIFALHQINHQINLKISYVKNKCQILDCFEDDFKGFTNRIVDYTSSIAFDRTTQIRSKPYEESVFSIWIFKHILVKNKETFNMKLLSFLLVTVFCATVSGWR